MTNYPTAADLAAMGITLTPDSWWTPRLDRAFRGHTHCTPHIPLDVLDLPQRKPYQSMYIGVTKRYSGWRGSWNINRRYHCGPTRLTELEAAWDRAWALGRNDVEVRG